MDRYQEFIDKHLPKCDQCGKCLCDDCSCDRSCKDCGYEKPLNIFGQPKVVGPQGEWLCPGCYKRLDEDPKKNPG